MAYRPSSLAAVAAGFVALAASSCNTEAPVAPVQETQHAVTYVVTGTGTRARVSYRNVKGETENAVVPLPWKYEFFAKSGAMVMINAGEAGEPGSFKVQVTSDGKVVFEQQSESANSVAISTGGTLP
jgi:hypothetical protein